MKGSVCSVTFEYRGKGPGRKFRVEYGGKGAIGKKVT